MNVCFGVFLDLVCENSIEYFCIDVEEGNWFEVIFQRLESSRAAHPGQAVHEVCAGPMSSGKED